MVAISVVPTRAPALSVVLALLLLPALPGATAGPGLTCGADAILCPPATGVVATCRAVGFAVVGPTGPGQNAAVVTARVPSGVGYAEERTSTADPVDLDVAVGDVRISVRGLTATCYASYGRSAPTSNEQRSATGITSIKQVEVITAGAALSLEGMYFRASLYDPGWGLQRYATCMWARTLVSLVDIVTHTTCLPGVAAADLGVATVGFGARWNAMEGADPGLAIEGLAALRISVPTEQGDVHVFLGAATVGLEPFPLPGPS